MAEPDSGAVGVVAVANLVQLCKELRLPVAYKVFERLDGAAAGAEGAAAGSHPRVAGGGAGGAAAGTGTPTARGGSGGGGGSGRGRREFYVVVHVLSDHAFKKYGQHASRSDLPLLRGLLLKVVTDAPVVRALSCGVQQAFLPKFENEGQDDAVADKIVAGAGARYMVVTIKHSGSLVTLSAEQGFAAKNSLDNDFTAGAAALLRAHYERAAAAAAAAAAAEAAAEAAAAAAGGAEAAGGAGAVGVGGDADPGAAAAAAGAALARLMAALRARRLAVSFEMVTGCHGHHGQVPAGEYLVATSAHTLDAAGRPVFLPWQAFLEFCLEQGLPLNDAWLFAGTDYASAARDALDALALAGGPTARALAELGRLAQAGAARGCVHLPGTYPHAEWQGDRIEGFVVSEGQPSTPEVAARLRALAPRMAVERIGVCDARGAAARRPYQSRLAAAGGDAEAVRAQVKAENRGWLPQPRLEAAPIALREAVLAAIAASAAAGGAGGGGGDAPALFVELPRGASAAVAEGGGGEGGGQGVLYSRAALAHCAPARLKAELAAALEAAAAAAVAPGCGDGCVRVPGDAALLRRLLTDLEAAEGGGGGEGQQAVLEAARSKAARALSGGAAAAAALRYKKKMLLWTPPTPAAAHDPAAPPAPGGAASGSAAPAAAAAGAAQTGAADPRAGGGAGGGGAGGSSERAGGESGASSESGASGASAGVIGYCMMTFVIRNGLTALGLGLPTYLGYVSSLARSWGLTQRQAAQVAAFARAWAAWIARRGGAASISSATYLDQAEPFAAAFLESGCSMGADGGGVGARPPGAFQGLILLIDADEALVAPLARLLRVQHILDPGKLPPYSKQLVEQGSLLRLAAGDPPPKGLRTLLDAAARHLFLYVRKPRPQQGAGGRGCGADAPAAKRMFGIHQSKVRLAEAALASAKLGPADAARRRMAAADGGGGGGGEAGAAGAEAEAEAEAAAVAAWTGAGAPLPPADPSVVVCFVSIPGSGKTAIADGLGATVPGVEKPSSLEVLNSDRLKRAGGNFQANRYWHHVAAAAESHAGDGHVRCVVADRNLVPSPPGNLARVAGILKESGAASLALVPSCAGVDPASQQDLYAGLPDLPFPLELVALCALRTAERAQHEGGLDAASPSCVSVVAKFAHFYRDTTRGALMQRLRSQFGAAVELPVMEVGPGEERQVPLEILQHLAQGISSIQEGASPPLPAEWEARARALLLSEPARSRILALQLPLGACRADLAAAARGALRLAGGAGAGLEEEPSLPSALAQLTTGAAGAGAEPMSVDGGAGVPGETVRYIAIAGFDNTQLRAAALLLLAPPPGAPAEGAPAVAAGDAPAAAAAEVAQAAAGAGGDLKPEMHVTLWHADDPVLGPNLGLRDALLAAVGSEVAFEVVAVDSSPEVTAAQVQLLSGPEGAGAKPYLHVTLAVAKGAQAKDANGLPARVADGSARRVALAEPLQLVGQLLAFAEG